VTVCGCVLCESVWGCVRLCGCVTVAVCGCWVWMLGVWLGVAVRSCVPECGCVQLCVAWLGCVAVCCLLCCMWLFVACGLCVA
jgi:hypothetical protein